jgi:hypothetical protein
MRSLGLVGGYFKPSSGNDRAHNKPASLGGRFHEIGVRLGVADLLAQVSYLFGDAYKVPCRHVSDVSSSYVEDYP